MSKIACTICLISLCYASLAQKKKEPVKAPATITIPLKPENWTFETGKVEFAEYKSSPAMKILAGAGLVVLKDFSFGDGIIEFDHEPLHPYFASFYFHFKDQKENECFYFRTQRAGDSQAGDAV